MPSSINVNQAAPNALSSVSTAFRTWHTLHTLFQRLYSGKNSASAKADDTVSMENHLSYPSSADLEQTKPSQLPQKLFAGQMKMKELEFQVSVNNPIAQPQTNKRKLTVTQKNMARMVELAILGGKATAEEEIATIDAEFTRLLVKRFAS